MQSSPWLNARTSPAICPKCNAPALHRSHAHSRMEERRKHMTGKRPYRCHICGYRSWFDETALRYPASAQKPLAPGVAGVDVPVPDLHLDDALRDGELPGVAGTLDRTPPTRKRQAEAPEKKAASAPPQDLRTVVPAGVAGTHDIPARPKSETAKKKPEEAPKNAQTAAEEVAPYEAMDPPVFDPDSGRPVSAKVGTAFHHHARNKSRACPACGEYALYRSRARNLGESLRKKLGTRRPYRCHRCGWRGWMQKR